jgi:hypothetical protein
MTHTHTDFKSIILFLSKDILYTKYKNDHIHQMVEFFNQKSTLTAIRYQVTHHMRLR